LFFILIGLITAFWIASGLCYTHDYNLKGAVFLIIGLILTIGTYQYYQSSHKKRKGTNYRGSANDNTCGYFDCGHVLDCPTSADCRKVGIGTDFDCGSADCDSMDCSRGDCHHGWNKNGMGQKRRFVDFIIPMSQKDRKMFSHKGETHANLCAVCKHIDGISVHTICIFGAHTILGRRVVSASYVDWRVYPTGKVENQ
jgi:hypothetical protein